MHTKRLAAAGFAMVVALAACSAPGGSNEPSGGGNGSPPYNDDDGHLHGPGGPVFMGRGGECTAERNHCQRDPAWFAVGNLVAGKLYRAVPVFEYNGKWHNWRGKEEDYARLLRTKVGTKDTLLPGQPVVWFVDESSKKFVDTEYSVEFTMFDKVVTKGDGQAPIYKTLTEETGEGIKGEIKWNFTKFLVNPQGHVIARFEPPVRPLDPQIVAAIEHVLPGA